jgi:sulfite exporter TauE/SafE
MELSYTLAFTTGFVGGFGHCIGMCGPIITACTFHGSSDWYYPPVIKNFLPHLFYNTGRITTYMFIGAVMGLTGSFINTAGGMAGFQNIVAVVAGLIMIIMGVSISGVFSGISWLEKHNSLILRTGKKLLQGETSWVYYPLGALFGFLPCGLSYTVFMAAAGTGSMLSGMLTALFFGIGTLPALLLFGFTAGYLSTKVRGMLYKSAGIVIVIMGVYYLLKSMRLV